MIRIVNTFPHKKSGKSGKNVQNYITNHYLSTLGLLFQPINNSLKKIPEGYILNSQDIKICTIEVKHIEYRDHIDNGNFHVVKLYNSIEKVIDKARKQFQTIQSEKIPNILYLYGDDSDFDLDIIMESLFGRMITVVSSVNGIVYEGFQGIYKNDNKNKFKDDLISGLIAYVPYYDDDGNNSYKLFIIQNSKALPIPAELLDKEHIEKHYIYQSDGTLHLVN